MGVVSGLPRRREMLKPGDVVAIEIAREEVVEFPLRLRVVPYPEVVRSCSRRSF